MDLSLLALRGPDQGREFRWRDRDSVIFGRGGTPSVDLSFPHDDQISREHLLLECAPGGVVARAMKEGRTFLLNGQETASAALVDGDEIALGRSVFRLCVHDPRPRPRSGELHELPDVRRRSLSDFELGAEIGRGTLGVVREARDRDSGERLAVKVLRRDDRLPEEAHRYFLREMSVLGRLNHPAIARLRCVGRDGDAWFIGMDLLPGTSLERRIDEEGPLPEAEVVAIGLAVLAGLQHAHGQGVVHRDIKPSNVMVWGAGAATHACLVDFGLAKNVMDSGTGAQTATGEARGTLLYGAPECLRDAKRARAPADLFSVGATLYHALTGASHLGARADGRYDIPTILEVRAIPVRTRRPEASEALAEVIERALKPSLKDRWTSAAAMRSALATLGGSG